MQLLSSEMNIQTLQNDLPLLKTTISVKTIQIKKLYLYIETNPRDSSIYQLLNLVGKKLKYTYPYHPAIPAPL